MTGLGGWCLMRPWVFLADAYLQVSVPPALQGGLDCADQPQHACCEFFWPAKDGHHQQQNNNYTYTIRTFRELVMTGSNVLVVEGSVLYRCGGRYCGASSMP